MNVKKTMHCFVFQMHIFMNKVYSYEIKNNNSTKEELEPGPRTVKME